MVEMRGMCCWMSGLDKVLYVRCTQGLLDGLDRLREKRQRETEGLIVSRASMARILLWESLERGV
jgi:hypothetical protein